MLELILDVLNVSALKGELRERLMCTASAMATFLGAVTHPDGGIALLSDSSPEVAPPTRDLLDYAARITGSEVSERDAFPDTGYFVVRSPGVYLILDGGDLGPEHLPAHGHADLFTYELSLGGHRFVVDTGVGTYEKGELRDYVRSTAAHNTVVVDGVSQAECWHRFRVARRFSPEDVRFERDGDVARFGGAFGGYGVLIGDGLRHERDVVVDLRAGEVRVSDVVTGSGSHAAESFVHLHPEVAAKASGDEVVLRREGVEARLVVTQGFLEERTTPYCPDFNIQMPRKTFVVRAYGEPPLRLGYRILWNT